MDSIDEKYGTLQSLIRKAGSMVIGYSGGCDSTLLAAVAHKVLGKKSLLVLVSFETFPPHEIGQALETARALGLPVIKIEENMLSDEDFTANTPERCYYCKKKIFTRLRETAQMYRFSSIADGSNMDDSKERRPGSRAAREMGVISPLEEAGFTKNDVRELSRRMNLPTWDKPSFACLATRIPHGTRIESAYLEQTDAAERYLKNLGFSQARVRRHGDIARIEVGADEIQRLVDCETRRLVGYELKKLGYVYVTMDLSGYTSGSMDSASRNQDHTSQQNWRG